MENNEDIPIARKDCKQHYELVDRKGNTIMEHCMQDYRPCPNVLRSGSCCEGYNHERAPK